MHWITPSEKDTAAGQAVPAASSEFEFQGYFAPARGLAFLRFASQRANLEKAGAVSKRCSPVAEQTQILQRQIQNLRRTRDLLLPRLLSGQISLTTKENYANA